MNSSWYQKLFGRAQGGNLEVTQAKAEHGDAEAQFGLGLKYANGEGMAQDYGQAAQWYLKAASQSHALAQFNLAMMYARGQGVPLDDAEAVSWFRKAASLGDAGAQFNLGIRQHRASFGKPPKDALESRIEAYKWCCLAAAQGYKGSDAARVTLTLTLTREELADGNQRAAAFVVETPVHPQVVAA